MLLPISLKRQLGVAILFGFACNALWAQAKPADVRKRGPAEYARPAPPAEPDAKPRQAPANPRPTVTLTQVERATGGQVIGARKVIVQGRRLNQIKLKMPDGRIIIYSRLFDEFGRSVDTVESIESVSEPDSRTAEQ